MNKLNALLKPILDYIPTISDWHAIARDVDEIIKQNRIVEQLRLEDVPYNSKTYTRNSICYERLAPWELVMTRWNSGDFSPIHAHPAYTLYYPLIGTYNMDFYSLGTDGRPEFQKRQHLNPMEYVSYVGEIGRYDNYIHQVFAHADSVTLHIYSELGTKGQKY